MSIENIFAAVVPASACQRCFDTGIWLSPRHEVLICPRVQMREPHAEPNEAALILRRAMSRLFGESKFINSQLFDLARILTIYTKENPLHKEQIFELFWSDTELTETQKLRRFHDFIAELRDSWLLPVGSRKAEPYGYWIITDIDDYKAWFKSVKAAPITQLSTIHRNAKANFPVLAEQFELEFWKDFAPEVETNAV